MISEIEPVELVWDGFLKNLKRQDTPSRVFYKTCQKTHKLACGMNGILLSRGF